MALTEQSVEQLDWHSRAPDRVLERLSSDRDGLSSTEAARRLARVGANRVEPAEREGLVGELVESVTEPMQLLLVAVAVLSAVWGELRDAVVIGVIIVVVAGIEAVTELRARRALDALRARTRPQATVVRDGRAMTVDGVDLVPGDVLLVETGDQVPADARLLSAASLRVDESALTGESTPVGKSPDPVPAGAPLADRRSMLHAGTAVVAGRGRAVVTATGGDSEWGRVGHLTEEAREPDSPLQQAMRDLARVIVVAAVGVSVLVPTVGVLRGEPLREMVLAGLALAFATVPEELPVLVTVLLAVGGRRLARHHVLLRRLRAGETIGEVTFVLTDKTGTLTANRLVVDRVHGQRQQVLEVALGAVPPERRTQERRADPLLAAIVRAAEDAGITAPDPVAGFPFDPDRRRASQVVPTQAGVRIVVVGAPEAVMERCTAPPPDDVAGRARQLGEEGLRVLAVAHRDATTVPADADHAERRLTLDGLIGLLDPPREGVPAAVEALHGAGIATVMVTGDLPETARAVAQRAGLPDGELLHGGSALAALDDDQLRARLAHGTVVARATPADKLHVATVLQERGERVAVTGDGVNDAPALAAADVGVAMGERGTDLAREAADLVLTDDAYPTLVTAVAAGRSLGSQLRRAVGFYLGVKLAVVLVVGVPIALGLGTPFQPVHVILVELFMDLGASLAFVNEPDDPAALSRPPRAPGRRFLDRTETERILGVAVVLPVGVLGALLATRWLLDPALVTTVTLATWLIAHTAVAWTMRADPRAGLRANPAFPAWTATSVVVAVAAVETPLGGLVGLVPATAGAWAVIAVAVAVTTAAALGTLRLLARAS